METVEDFLLNAGSNQHVDLKMVGSIVVYGRGRAITIRIPERVELFCGSCQGKRGFVADESEIEVAETHRKNVYLSFKCKDCESAWKTYSLRVTSLGGEDARFLKIGEVPPFGPKFDPRVAALLGADEHLYRKGLDSEAAGMGIGAFAYYRRLLENRRAVLFERVLSVADKLGAPDDLIESLKKAQADRQFTKSLESIRAGPLQAIYINGHNPLTLLYDAVSDGLHAQSDDENLQTAQTIRLLLADLALRLEQVLSDHQEVEEAVTRLLKAQAERKARQSSDKS